MASKPSLILCVTSIDGISYHVYRRPPWPKGFNDIYHSYGDLIFYFFRIYWVNKDKIESIKLDGTNRRSLGTPYYNSYHDIAVFGVSYYHFTSDKWSYSVSVEVVNIIIIIKYTVVSRHLSLDSLCTIFYYDQ